MRLTQRKARAIVVAFWTLLPTSILVAIGSFCTTGHNGKDKWSIWPVSAHGHILFPMLMLVVWIVIGIVLALLLLVAYISVWEKSGWTLD